MISEPELEDPENGPRVMPSVPAPRVGDGPQAPPAGTPGQAAAPETIAGRRPRRLLSRLPSQRAPWLWALGGAVVASAVWAGGLYAYGPAGPDLGGYRISRNLCLDAELPALSASLGKPQFPRAAVDEQLAIDRAHCTLTLMGSGVDINYTLHKRTDPGPEFDATVTQLAPGGAPERRVMRIPDLGERAYLVTDPSRDTRELKVLDGQAVLTVAVSHSVNYTVDPATGEYQVPERADFSGIEPAMVEDLRDLMDALKQ
ncbi:hypothetical protein [Streptomyces sp. NPDC059479]|uniref:hypothetical protein n=1 Tax=Streptomyces sp. NPDC059479 TaxID=3346848 RepID=UPI0036AED35B